MEYLDVLINMKDNTNYLKDEYNKVFGKGKFEQLVNEDLYSNKILNKSVGQYISDIGNPSKNRWIFIIKLCLFFELDMNKYMFGILEDSDLHGKFRQITNGAENDSITFLMWYMDSNSSCEPTKTKLMIEHESKNSYSVKLDESTYQGSLDCQNELDNDLILINKSGQKMFIKLYMSNEKLIDRHISFGYILKNEEGEKSFPKISKCLISKKGTISNKYLEDNLDWIKGFLKLRNDMFLFTEDSLLEFANRIGGETTDFDIRKLRNLYYGVDIQEVTYILSKNHVMTKHKSILDTLIEAGINSRNANIESYMYNEDLTSNNIIKNFHKYVEFEKESICAMEEPSEKKYQPSEFSTVYIMDPLIGRAGNQNGDYGSSYVNNDYSRKVSHYFYDLSKMNIEGKNTEFSMFYLDISSIKISDSILIDENPITFKCNYNSKDSIEGTLVIEFKNNKGPIFDKLVSIVNFDGTIEFELPKISRYLWDSLIEICFVFRASLMKTQKGNIEFHNIRFEKIK